MQGLLSRYILAGALSGCSFFCAAQTHTHTAGARWSNSSGFTFRQMLSEKHAAEVILTFRWGGPAITGLYERTYALGKYPLKWYWGGGLHLGYHRRKESKMPDENLYIQVGADAITGVLYTFTELPLNLSVDFKPSVSFTAEDAWAGEWFGLSVRYCW